MRLYGLPEVVGVSNADAIPVIDLFAGPGGLGEGFARLRSAGQNRFKIVRSIEKDHWAHSTLCLRSFFRQFDRAPESYYSYCRGDIDRHQLFQEYPKAAEVVQSECGEPQELGPRYRASVREQIRRALRGRRGRSGNRPWVLLGGPPCQAYSMAGRSRLRPVLGDAFDEDHRHTLYKEYLRIIADHGPAVFVMENVAGLLSSKLGGELIVERITEDLRNAAGPGTYQLYPIAPLEVSSSSSKTATAEDDWRRYIVKCENHGIPQRRHRLFLVGIRSTGLKGASGFAVGQLRRAPQVPIRYVVAGLPAIRSGLSQQPDSDEAWESEIRRAAQMAWPSEVNGPKSAELTALVRRTARSIRAPVAGCGGPFIRRPPSRPVQCGYKPRWFLDARIGGVCNHEARKHMALDLRRYLYVACSAQVYRVSPKLREFPGRLRPRHNNIAKSLRFGMFCDRFRAQVSTEPATTITSHIHKDGHYFIHFNPKQCRSLSVREAARVQTFSDNYLFEGPRTEQYRQVGNAVPPLLAHGIARVVSDVIEELF